MLKQSGGIVASIIWIIWFGALEGKKRFPSVLGSSEFQWTCAAVVAILIPVGTLIALRGLSRPDKRRPALVLLIACIFPLAINLTTYGMGGPMIARTLVSLSSLNDRDAEMIAKFTRQAVEPEDFKQRKKAAWALYSLWGVRCAWRDDSGTLSIYSPTDKEETTWRKTKATNSDLKASAELIDAQLKQFPWLFALNFGCFTLISLGGLGWHTYRRRSEQDGRANSRVLHPGESPAAREV